MSTFSPFIAAVEAKILAESTYVTTADNILYCDNIDIASLQAESFPRMEFFIGSAKGDGYTSQRDIEWEFDFSFIGYLKRTATQNNSESLWTKADFNTIWEFAEESMAIVLSLIDDTQRDSLLAPNFLMFRGTPALVVSCELIPYVSTFAGHVTAVFQKEDTNGK
jgi:hypothetical protein